MKVNPRVAIIREAISKIVDVLTNRGIRVTQQGMTAFVTPDPKTGKPLLVNIPYLPDDASDELIQAIQGFIDHECGHVIFTDFTVANPIAPCQNLHRMWNIVEDTFVERKMQERFLGSGYNLDSLRKFIIDKYTIPSVNNAKSEEELQKHLLIPMIRAWAGQSIFERFMDPYWPRMKAITDRLGPDMPEIIRKCQSTLDCVNAAKDIQKRIKRTEEKKPPAPSKGVGGAPSSDPDDSEETSEEGDAGSPPPIDPLKEETVSKDGKGLSIDPEHAPEETKPEKPEAKEKDKDKDEDPAKEEPKPKPEPKPESKPSEEKAPEKKVPDEESKKPEPAKGGGDDDGDEDSKDPDDSPSDPDDSDEGDSEATPSAGDPDDENKDEEKPSEVSAGMGKDDEAKDGEEPSKPKPSEPETEGDEGDEGEEESPEPAKPPKATKPGKPPKSESEPIPSDKTSKFFDDVPSGFDDIASEVLSQESKKMAKTSEYLTFTTDYDVVELLPVPKDFDDNPKTKMWVKEMCSEVDAMISSIQKDVERAVAARSAAIYTGGHRSGKLHGASLSRILSGRDDVFRRKEENLTKDVAICLVDDLSGSMDGSKVKTAAYASYALSSVLDRLQISHEVCGFTTLRVSSKQKSDMAKHSNPDGYSRIEPLYQPIIKGFGERLSPTVRQRFAIIANSDVEMRNNVDGESIYIAFRRLMLRKEKRKIMIVLSDGMPAAESTRRKDSHYGSGLNEHLKSIIKLIESSGTDVVGIGIQDRAVKTFYKKSVTISRVSELPGEVMKIIRGMIAS
jgi:cobalamin biosynthesis protein CobT